MKEMRYSEIPPILFWTIKIDKLWQKFKANISFKDANRIH